MLRMLNVLAVLGFWLAVAIAFGWLGYFFTDMAAFEKASVIASSLTHTIGVNEAERTATGWQIVAFFFLVLSVGVLYAIPRQVTLTLKATKKTVKKPAPVRQFDTEELQNRARAAFYSSSQVTA